MGIAFLLECREAVRSSGDRAVRTFAHLVYAACHSSLTESPYGDSDSSALVSPGSGNHATPSIPVVNPYRQRRCGVVVTPGNHQRREAAHSARPPRTSAEGHDDV